MPKEVITRFAPSPTGSLHLGGMRTAALNWLFAKSLGGKFILRIEDTDRERSKKIYEENILEALEWLEIDFDQIVHQSKRKERHIASAMELLEAGNAYYCYTTKEELEEWKKNNPNKKFQSPWRDSTKKRNIKPVLRLKNHINSSIVFSDMLLGNIEVSGTEIDDIVLLRSDNSPTYMLSVVVDDHDMGITHIIRGDDHLTNTFRQIAIYKHLNWNLPEFAHLPLIYTQEGKKMSKRNPEFQSIREYRAKGFLKESIQSYILSLGWGRAVDNIMRFNEAIKVFNLSEISKSPSRFDSDKLSFINKHWISSLDTEDLLSKINITNSIQNEDRKYVIELLSFLKERATNLLDLKDSLIKVLHPKLTKEAEVLLRDNNLLLKKLLTDIEKSDIKQNKLLCRELATMYNAKISLIYQLLRSAILGEVKGIDISKVMDILGKKEVIHRIKQYVT